MGVNWVRIPGGPHYNLLVWFGGRAHCSPSFLLFNLLILKYITMILCFSFSFDEGDEVHWMVMDKKHEVFEDFMKRIYCNSDGSCPGMFSPPSEQEGVHFITSEWGVVMIDVNQDESLTQSWLNDQVHRVISLWAVTAGYSEATDYSEGHWFFLWKEPKDPTE